MPLIRMDEIRYSDREEFKTLIHALEYRAEEPRHANPGYYIASNVQTTFLNHYYGPTEDFKKPVETAETSTSETSDEEPTAGGQSLPKKRIGPRRGRPSPGSNQYGYKFYPYKLATPAEASRGRYAPYAAKKIDSILGSKVLEIQAAKINRSSISHGRVLKLDQIETLDKLKETLLLKFEKPTAVIREKINKLQNFDSVVISGVSVEGFDFKKSKDLHKKTKLSVITHGDKSLLVLDNKIYFTLEGRKDVEELIKSAPITEAAFKRVLSNQYASSVSSVLKDKINTAIKLENHVAQINKEIGELKFVEQAIKEKTTSHFDSLLDKIKSNTDVAELQFLRSGIMFRTTDLWGDLQDRVTKEVSKHYLGQYEVFLEIIGTYKLKYRNLKSPYLYARGMTHHPHGNCTGSYTTVLGQAARSLDYHTFILSVIEMLRSLNPAEKTRTSLNANGWTETKPPDSKLTECKSFSEISLSHYFIGSQSSRPENEDDEYGDGYDDEDLDDDDEED